MQYFGGKFRVRRIIAEFINSYKPISYLEPFCGSCWVGQLVQAETRICCDLNSDLIALWQAIQSGWEPPDLVTENDYQAAKLLESPNPLKAFIGFGCSFAGKYFGGYARGGHGADAKTTKSQLVKRMYAKTTSLESVQFVHCNYLEAMTHFSMADLVYCDPPYRNTTKFYGLPAFDHTLFWEAMRAESTRRLVLISEYEAPDDFLPILHIPTRTDIRSSTGVLIPRIEQVFVHESSI